MNKRINQYIQISIGVLLVDLAFFFFQQPSKLVNGGMLGISIILEPFYSQIGSWFTASIFMYIANSITLIIGGILLGKDFFIKTVFASLLSPTILFLLERTCDENFFLQSVSEGGYYIVVLFCASLLTGVGLGLAIKNNGSTGGMDVIQKICSKYLHVPYSLTMYFTDWVVVLFSGFTFIGGFSFNIELVIYGLVSVFACSIIIDAIALNARFRRTVYIISDKPEEIKEMIYEKINRGVTFSEVIGGYTGEKKKMVICTMDKTEAYRIKEYIKQIDEKAFTFITSCKEVMGEYGDKRI